MSRFLKTMALAVGVSVAVGSIAQAETKHKVFLSMSYIGNDWQAEATNMVKALALSKDFVNKVDLQVQVAGPSAQRQIQQINAMVQAGAEAIVVYPISPTALNQVVKNACDKGVKIFTYDLDITEPCAYNVGIDQVDAGRHLGQWLVDQLHGKGNVVMVTGVPGTSVDIGRTKGAKEVFANIRTSRWLASWSGCGARPSPALKCRSFSPPAIGIRSMNSGPRSAASR